MLLLEIHVRQGGGGFAHGPGLGPPALKCSVDRDKLGLKSRGL